MSLMSVADDLDMTEVMTTVRDTSMPEENEDSPNVVSIRKNARGRAAFADGVCHIHGGDNVTPCYKFSVLPGDGRGPYRPNLRRRTRSFAMGFVKPLVLCGVVGGSLYGLFNVGGNLLDVGVVPPTPQVSVVTPTPTRVVK